MIVIDTFKMLYSYLSTNTNITSAGIAVYGPPGLPINYVLGKTIVFVGAGGWPHASLPITLDRIQFRCYGQTSSVAREVNIALASALNRKAHTQITIGGLRYVLQHSICTSNAYDMIEPSAEWPFVSVFYAIQFLENALV